MLRGRPPLSLSMWDSRIIAIVKRRRLRFTEAKRFACDHLAIRRKGLDKNPRLLTPNPAPQRLRQLLPTPSPRPALSLGYRPATGERQGDPIHQVDHCTVHSPVDSSSVFSQELFKNYESRDLSLGSSREAHRQAPYLGIVLGVERIMGLESDILSLKLTFTTC